MTQQSISPADFASRLPCYFHATPCTDGDVIVSYPTHPIYANVLAKLCYKYGMFTGNVNVVAGRCKTRVTWYVTEPTTLVEQLQRMQREGAYEDIDTMKMHAISVYRANHSLTLNEEDELHRCLIDQRNPLFRPATHELSDLFALVLTKEASMVCSRLLALAFKMKKTWMLP